MSAIFYRRHRMVKICHLVVGVDRGELTVPSTEEAYCRRTVKN